MRQPRWRAILCAALIATPAVLLAGCGELSKAEYEHEMAKIGVSVDRATRRISTADKDADRRSRRELERGIDQMEELNPPSEVEDAHNELISGLRGMVKLLARYEGREQEAAVKLFEELQSRSSPMRKIERAQKAFDEKGYKVFGADGKPGTTS